MESAATTSREIGPNSEDSSAISFLSVVEEHARKFGHEDPAGYIHSLEVCLGQFVLMNLCRITLSISGSPSSSSSFLSNT